MMDVFPCEEQYTHLLVQLVSHDIKRSTDDLLMDIGDIEGNESERHECDTHDPSIEDDNENEITEGKHLCHHLVEDDKYREK